MSFAVETYNPIYEKTKRQKDKKKSGKWDCHVAVLISSIGGF